MELYLPYPSSFLFIVHCIAFPPLHLFNELLNFVEVKSERIEWKLKCVCLKLLATITRIEFEVMEVGGLFLYNNTVGNTHAIHYA